jgi:hypothetical protein
MIRMTLTMPSGQFVWRDFESQELADQYVAEVTLGQNWGPKQQIITHAEIPAIPAIPGHGIVPAEFDSLGNEISPMHPATATIPEVPAIPAWNEIIPGFTVEFTDVTVQVLQDEKQQKIAELQAQLAALQGN